LNRPPTHLFQAMIQGPLIQVLGTPLLSVAYDVLSCDLADFDVGAPNGSGGCQGVQMMLCGGQVILAWDWRRAAFRDDSIAFYLAIRDQPERYAGSPSMVGQDAVGVVRVDATEAVPWRDLAGEVLKRVTVWGWRLSNGSESPQAVSFSFPSGEVTVGIGYSARTMAGGAIGDGDELLVWDEPCWRQQLQRAADGSVLTPLCHLSEESASHR
jgi:hypothetical protein